MQVSHNADRGNLKTHLAEQNLITIDPASRTHYPDGLAQLCKNEFKGMLIEKVFSEAEIEKVIRYLDRKQNDLQPTYFGAVLGCPVLQPAIDKTVYWQESDIFRSEFSSLFECGLEAKLEEIFSLLSGGRTVALPRESPSHVYTPATIRFFYPHKGGIGSHTESEYFNALNFASDPLGQRIDIENILNYFITLKKTEKGGEFWLYDLLWEETEFNIKKAAFMSARREVAISKFPKIRLVPELGDMVIFNGKRWHKVSDVKGETNRITIGGFIAISKDDSKIVYWH